MSDEDLAGRVLEKRQPLPLEPQPEGDLGLVVDHAEDLLVDRRGVEGEQNDRYRDQAAPEAKTQRPRW